ncbi:NIPSNAP family protein [Chelativorans salis]|uniref:NIPSNAP family protein n=1 Tax=Chelativorans salis TaxID=2978478 RepID=A0ABT2LHS8_9HYPH|nr:NIPSNAP family protein [Chelativorans sp. EGI FJ00035]MCT7373741.1 NIPSNAP family protein [Chelativorans sp. EGI FJ00035]
MIIARWYCNARFGKKQELIDRIKQWWGTIGKEVGQTDYAVYTGSIGAEESLVTVDVRVASLAELDEQWNKLADREDHKAFGRDIEPLLVSGSTRWEILRAAN